jgi:hypothetical protein
MRRVTFNRTGRTIGIYYELRARATVATRCAGTQYTGSLAVPYEILWEYYFSYSKINLLSRIFLLSHMKSLESWQSGISSCDCNNFPTTTPKLNLSWLYQKTPMPSLYIQHNSSPELFLVGLLSGMIIIPKSAHSRLANASYRCYVTVGSSWLP